MNDLNISNPLAEVPTAEYVNGLLAWPKAVRQDLAELLLNSVREDFSSLAEKNQRETDELRKRVEQVVNGEVPLSDWRASLDRVEKSFYEQYPR